MIQIIIFIVFITATISIMELDQYHMDDTPHTSYGDQSELYESTYNITLNSTDNSTIRE